jgi:hypothetical protein
MDSQTLMQTLRLMDWQTLMQTLRLMDWQTLSQYATGPSRLGLQLFHRSVSV